MLFLHPSHVTLTTVEITDTDSTARVTFKFDQESFDFVFLHNYLYRVKIDNNQIEEKSLRFINDYLSKQFMLLTDNKKVDLEFTGHKKENTEIWLTYKGKIFNDADTVSVRNLLLVDYDLNQTNIVIIKKSNFEKGFVMNRDDYKIDVAMHKENDEVF